MIRKRVRTLLCRAGLQILDEYGDYDFLEYREHGKSLVIDALKRRSDVGCH